MATYRVVREGVSQKENGRLVDRPIGALIEVSDEAAPYLLAQGFIEAPEPEPWPGFGRTKREE